MSKDGNYYWLTCKIPLNLGLKLDLSFKDDDDENNDERIKVHRSEIPRTWIPIEADGDCDSLASSLESDDLDEDQTSMLFNNLSVSGLEEDMEDACEMLATKENSSRNFDDDSSTNISTNNDSERLAAKEISSSNFDDDSSTNISINNASESTTFRANFCLAQKEITEIDEDQLKINKDSPYKSMYELNGIIVDTPLHADLAKTETVRGIMNYACRSTGFMNDDNYLIQSWRQEHEDIAFNGSEGGE